jgi:AcrR family transcriptional regulator
MVQNSSKPRGRPRAYDPERALAEATKTFWQSGFAGTSLDALSDATGMNRPSLYGAFGDKRALYLATMDRYIANALDLMKGVMESDAPLAEALQRIYDLALSIYFPKDEAACGCFLIGTAVTESFNDPEVREKLGKALHEFDHVFEARFRRAVAQEELDEDADPASLAKLASAIVHTLALRSRSGDSRKTLHATAKAGVRMLCGG